MGFLDCFAYRSAKQRKYDSDHYLKWAFPYGEAQKMKITNLLNELTDEKTSIALSAYLIGKEAAIGDWQSDKHDLSLSDAINPIQKVLQNKRINLISIFLAMIEVDYTIDEELNYPSKEIILERAKLIAQEIEGI